MALIKADIEPLTAEEIAELERDPELGRRESTVAERQRHALLQAAATIFANRPSDGDHPTTYRDAVLDAVALLVEVTAAEKREARDA